MNPLLQPNPHRLRILQILNSKGILSFPELKSQMGFKTQKDCGRLAYHVSKLVKQSLVVIKPEHLYQITNHGKLAMEEAEDWVSKN